MKKRRPVHALKPDHPEETLCGLEAFTNTYAINALDKLVTCRDCLRKLASPAAEQEK